jgi:hypothetical protein
MTGAEIPLALAAMEGAGAAGAGLGFGSAAPALGFGAGAGLGAEGLGAGLLSSALGPSAALTGAELGNTAVGAAIPATSDASSALLQMLGRMGPEQANILAEQNAGFGPTGLTQTLASANPSNAGLGALGRITNFAQPVLNRLGRGADAYQRANAAMNLAGMGQRPHAPPAPVPPPMGGPPTLSSAIFARNGPQGGQGGGLPPEVIQMLLAQMMRSGR